MATLSEVYAPIRDYLTGRILAAWTDVNNKLYISNDPAKLDPPVARINLESLERIGGEGTPRSDRYRMTWRIGGIWPKHATTSSDLLRIEKLHALQSVILVQNHPGSFGMNPQIEMMGGAMGDDDMDGYVVAEMLYTVDVEIGRGN
jgi:hypothetical protein